MNLPPDARIIQGGRKLNKAKLWCVVFVGLNTILFTLLVLVTVFLIKDLNLEIEQNVELCVDCSYLVVHPDDELDGVSRRDDGTCCVEDDQNIYNLVHMYAGRWMKKKMAESNPKHSNYICGTENEMASIKVVGRTEKGEHIPHRKVLKWDNESELAIIPDNKHMTYHADGYIEIKRWGLYFVYSQLVLEHDGPGPLHEFREGPVTYQHSIRLMKAGMRQFQAQSILKNIDTRCSSTKDTFRFTSHIGSAFELHGGDRLFVVVNNVHEVVADPRMNHFGVHRL